jgi:hypothetical protein
MRKAVTIAFIALLVALAGSLQPSHAGPFCIETDADQGAPDCSYWTWAQCRASQPGVVLYCYMNTGAGYVFDMRDLNNPRVIIPKPLRKPRTRIRAP